MTHSITKNKNKILGIKDTQHNKHSVFNIILLSVVVLYAMDAECSVLYCYAECRYAECHGAVSYTFFIIKSHSL